MKSRYAVKKLEEGKQITVQVPGSKSITNRALLLAALSEKKCTLQGILFSDDSRAFLDSLEKLGFSVEINEKEKEAVIQGMAGKIPNRKAVINVRSAGTAARFLTVMLALAGGEYELQASAQMCKRPMQPLLDILKKAGVIFEFMGEEDHFPFYMKSDELQMSSVSVDTGISSQFASALLMAGVLRRDGLEIYLEGDRSKGAYIQMTLAMMKQFGISVEQEQNRCRVLGKQSFGVDVYPVEPDVSGACYFYAMAPLLRATVKVKNVHSNSLQGDIRFLQVLRDMGCQFQEDADGICISGRNLPSYNGLEVSMKDFSDQTMTLCAIALFAVSETLIRNIGHIRFQESDRIHAVLTELTRMGILCEEVPEADGIRIYPGQIHEAEIETYEDHRMAMAFTLIGLKTGKITILNPDCCRKTFENYFKIIEEIYEQ